MYRLILLGVYSKIVPYVHTIHKHQMRVKNWNAYYKSSPDLIIKLTDTRPSL